MTKRDIVRQERKAMLADALTAINHDNLAKAIEMLIWIETNRQQEESEEEEPVMAVPQVVVSSSQSAGKTLMMALSIAKKNLHTVKRRHTALKSELEVTRRAAINIRAQLRTLENDFSDPKLTDSLDMLDAMERAIARCLKNFAP